MSCEPGDCTVAHGYEDFWGGFIFRSNVVKIAREAAGEARSWVRGKTGIESIKDRKREVLKKRDARAILEEQGLYCFDYCPDCGSFVNWPAITVEYQAA